jgi:hypothetical protein
MSLMDEEDRAAREQELFPDSDFNLDQTKPPEAPAEGEAGEVRIPATLASVVPEPLKLSTRLAVGDVAVATVEHLLSALEVSARAVSLRNPTCARTPQLALPLHEAHTCAPLRTRTSTVVEPPGSLTCTMQATAGSAFTAKSVGALYCPLTSAQPTPPAPHTHA